MKKNMFALLLSITALTQIRAEALSAKTVETCLMCSSLVCAKCDLGKTAKSLSKGKDLKCCCDSCYAIDKTTVECRQACGIKARK